MASKWTPVQRRDLTDFLEQGALVTVDDYTIGVYRNGTGAKVDLPEHIRLCRLTPASPAPEGVTQPDSPGWWAWEGYFDFGEDDTDPADIQRRLCEVKEVMRWAFIANGTAHLIEHMVGTWTRVYMPWERPPASQG